MDWTVAYIVQQVVMAVLWMVFIGVVVVDIRRSG
jgi:hypothetical protein